MAEKKTEGRKAIGEDNLENVSGGYVKQLENGKWYAAKYGPYSGMDYNVSGTYDTEEEARAAEKEFKNWVPPYMRGHRF